LDVAGQHVGLDGRDAVCRDVNPFASDGEAGRRPQQLRQVRLLDAAALRFARPRAGERRPDARSTLELRGGQRGDLVRVGVSLERWSHTRTTGRELTAPVPGLCLEIHADTARLLACHGSLPGGVYHPAPTAPAL